MFGVYQLTSNVKITSTDVYHKIQNGSFTYYGKDSIFLDRSQGHGIEKSNIMEY